MQRSFLASWSVDRKAALKGTKFCLPLHIHEHIRIEPSELLLVSAPKYHRRSRKATCHERQEERNPRQGAGVGLRNFEDGVQKLIDEMYKDPILRKTLGLQGTVTYESHTNLEPPNLRSPFPFSNSPTSFVR